MRLFLAIWLPADVLQALPLDLLREHLTRQGVRFTKEEKIHVTLRFLGNVDASAVESLVHATAIAVAAHPAVDLTAAGLGAFPHLDRPKAIWAGVLGDLESLQQLIVAATDPFAESAAGEFQPHLTLARVSPPSTKVGRALEPLVRQVGSDSFGSWTAHQVLLIETMPDGNYRIVAELPLSP